MCFPVGLSRHSLDDLLAVPGHDDDATDETILGNRLLQASRHSLLQHRTSTQSSSRRHAVAADTAAARGREPSLIVARKKRPWRAPRRIAPANSWLSASMLRRRHRQSRMPYRGHRPRRPGPAPGPRRLRGGRLALESTLAQPERASPFAQMLPDRVNGQMKEGREEVGYHCIGCRRFELAREGRDRWKRSSTTAGIITTR